MTIITGTEAIRMAQMLAQRGALRLEILGMRRNGASASQIIRKHHGLTARKKTALLVEFEAFIVRFAEVNGLPRPLFADRAN
jgi:hypothetical protein